MTWLMLFSFSPFSFSFLFLSLSIPFLFYASFLTLAHCTPFRFFVSFFRTFWTLSVHRICWDENEGRKTFSQTLFVLSILSLLHLCISVPFSPSLSFSLSLANRFAIFIIFVAKSAFFISLTFHLFSPLYFLSRKHEMQKWFEEDRNNDGFLLKRMSNKIRALESFITTLLICFCHRTNDFFQNFVARWLFYSPQVLYQTFSDIVFKLHEIQARSVRGKSQWGDCIYWSQIGFKWCNESCERAKRQGKKSSDEIGEREATMGGREATTRGRENFSKDREMRERE